MLPKSGDVITLNTYSSSGKGAIKCNAHGPMMIVGPSKSYGSQCTECYMIATGEKKTFVISHNSDYKIIQNANPAAANIVCASEQLNCLTPAPACGNMDG